MERLGIMLRQASGHEAVRFLATGGIAAAVNLVSRYVLSFWLSFEIALIVAYAIGMVTAYLLFRALVFGRSGRSRRSEVLRFVLVNIAAVAQVWLISVGLVRLLFPLAGITWHAEEIGHLIGVAVPALSSYIGHRHFTFGRSTTARRAEEAVRSA